MKQTVNMRNLFNCGSSQYGDCCLRVGKEINPEEAACGLNQ